MSDSLQQFTDFGKDLSLQCILVSSRGDELAAEWPGTRHWCVVLGGSYTFYYSQGPAHTNAPTMGDILHSLQIDCSCVRDGASFEEFCEEFGCVEDSRRAYRTYETCQGTCARIIDLIGQSAFETFMSLEEV